MPIDKRNIVLVGMPAAGKSTLGVMLAKSMRYNFIDTDITIQVENDATLAELIAAHGNDYLLKLEEGVLLNVTPSRCVIATGGSACYSAAAMEHLKTTGPVVYLRVSYEAVAARVGDVTARGVVMPAGYTFRDLYDERSALYEKYADIVVDTTDVSLADSVGVASQAIERYLQGKA